MGMTLPATPPQPKTGGALSDTLLSVANHVFAMAAAYLMAKGWSGETIQFVQGLAMVLVSFSIAFWQNGFGTTLDLVQSFVRRILTIVLAFAATKGWIDGDTGAAIVNAAGTLLPLIWTTVFNWKHPGPSLPGTTIVDLEPHEFTATT